MADEDRRTDGPSLELPSLSFGRRRRKKAPEPAPTPEPAPAPPASLAPAPEPEPEPTPPPLFVDEVVAAPSPPAPVRVPPAPVPPPERGPDRPAAPTKAPRRPAVALPALAGSVAAVVTGVLVGVVAVGLTSASLRGCEIVRGTSFCGDPGYLLLLGIVVVLVLLGVFLLRVWGVPEPGSTSLLAVGLLAVLAMLFLVGVLFEWWMILVVPACSALTFAAAHRVTTTYTEPGDR